MEAQRGQGGFGRSYIYLHRVWDDGQGSPGRWDMQGWALRNVVCLEHEEYVSRWAEGRSGVHLQERCVPS